MALALVNEEVTDGLFAQWDDSGVVLQVVTPSGAAVLEPDQAVNLARLLLRAAKECQEGRAA